MAAGMLAMRRSYWLSLVSLTRLAALVTAADVVYVTDLEIYTLLAPCAASAVSYYVGSATWQTQCGDGETELQSCVCSNTEVSKTVSSQVSSDLVWRCGSSATDDFSSASKVMELYCDQDATITFATPTENIVNAYITDLPQMEYLPPCAQSGVSYAVMGAGSSLCPEAAELYAPCVCSKSYVVDAVSETIRKSVKYSCSNNDDVTSAQNFYNEYCAMNEGTTFFAPPNGPPGDMTYYVTALPQFQSLRDCAQSGVSSAIMQQSTSLCGNGPQALASCACIKSGMYNYISSVLTSNVKYYCDNTATADVTSALSVLQYYCSAAESKVVAEVDESISQSYPTASAPVVPGSGSTAPARTTSGQQADATSSNSPGDNDGGDESAGSIGVAPIAGGVVGGLAVLALIGGVFFFMRRRRQQEKNGEQLPSGGDGNGFGGNQNQNLNPFVGKPELMGSSPSTPAMNNGKTGPYAPPPVPELHTPSHAPPPELDGMKTAYVSELPSNQVLTPHGQSPVGYGSPYGPPSPQGGYKYPQQMPQELSSPGYGYQPSPQLNGQPVYEFPANSQPHNQQAVGWQSGPVESYELDSNIGRRHA